MTSKEASQLFKNFVVLLKLFLPSKEDGQENVYNDLGIKVFDPVEDVLTQITDPNVVLETIATQSSYLEARKSIEERNVKKSNDVEPKAATKPKLKQSMYNDYSDNTREVFIDRMLESVEERG
ncbi:uncharacterized protein B0P05DRAFT_477956, partial [Gilbertella persicaria]|uniref:uncharacterized protein n=1 Tax=Gilbertella persicaria TaxID=101096 RepID=UPI002220B15C